ncbi:MAG: electron transfer flavoprotein subunit beta/FixA family protein [Synoicihabitans sp.]
MMKILVPLKRVADAQQPIRLSTSGRHVDHDSITPIANPFDAIALEEAVRMREGGTEVSEILAVTIGPATAAKELRYALASGADRAILVETDSDLDPWNISSVLMALANAELPDLVLMGKQAVDDDSNQVGQFLAARLEWPQATFVSSLKTTSTGLTLGRETDDGIEILQVALPAVVTCDLRLNEPRYAPLPAILRAKRKPLKIRTLADVGVVIEPRLAVVGMEPVTTMRSCHMLESLDELARQLRESAKLPK